jgi:4-diphosphocytidyl-2C-methyl-D-erythritol kinase
LAASLADRLPRLDLALLGSALEPAACRATPGLADSLARLRALTPEHPWQLTGSGGAAFALADTADAAQRLAAAAEAAGFPARACRTVPARLGPLPPQTPKK